MKEIRDGQGMNIKEYNKKYKRYICRDCGRRISHSGRCDVCLKKRKQAREYSLKDIEKKPYRKYFNLPKDKRGYRYFRDKDGKKVLVYRRVAEKKYGEIPKGFHVHHIDNVKDNNLPSNLILLHLKDHYKVLKEGLVIKRRIMRKVNKK